MSHLPKKLRIWLAERIQPDDYVGPLVKNGHAYWMGQRDGLALFLMAKKGDGSREPSAATYYEKKYGEQHTTHNWHVGTKP